jgi:hypothetical protein
MPEEPNISAENRDRAQKLAETFQTYARQPDSFERDEGRLEELSQPFAGEAPVNDVIEDVRIVSRLVYFARNVGEKIPVVQVEGVGKIPVLHYFPVDFWRRRPWFEDEFLFGPRSSTSRRNVLFVSADEMFEGFGRGLFLFLGYRFEGYNLWNRRSPRNTRPGSGPTPSTASGNPPPPSPGTAAPGASGFYVQLSCLHHHLAAYASPAYALTWRNLGSFTTPAYGVLPAGTWIFGAQGGMFPTITHDPTPVYIPPTFTPSTSCF